MHSRVSDLWASVGSLRRLMFGRVCIAVTNPCEAHLVHRPVKALLWLLKPPSWWNHHVGFGFGRSPMLQCFLPSPSLVCTFVVATILAVREERGANVRMSNSTRPSRKT
eukprot:scaffold798_cov367-Pavlova_lutheri.AAC.10